MSVSFYRPLLKEAWHRTWHHPLWWLFGVFVSFVGNGSLFLLLAQTVQEVDQRTGRIALWTKLFTANSAWSFLQGTARLAFTEPRSFFSLLLFWLVVLTLFLLLLWMIIAAVATLVTMIGASDDRSSAPSWSRIATNTKTFFWNIFGVFVLFRGILALATIGIGLFVIAIQGSLVHSILSWGGILIILIFSLLIYFFIPFSIAGIILDRLSFKKALQRAITLFKTNWLVSIEAAILLVVIQLFVKFAWGLLALLLLVPFLLLGIIFFFLALPKGIIATIVVAVIFFTILFLFLLGIFTTFEYTVWILLYRSFQADRAPTSKLLRLTEWIKKFRIRFISS